MSLSSKISIGNQGEDSVSQFLKDKGFSIIEKNFRVRSGEIDIIASKDDLLSFVEVKTRNRHYFSTSQVVTPAKQKKIISAAKFFIAQNNVAEKILRFDVAVVTHGTSEIHYIPNAFTEHSYNL